MNDFIARTYKWARPVMVTVTGSALIVIGIVMIPLPGPGMAAILAGLALLATEFAWARDLLAFVKRMLKGIREGVKAYCRRAEK